MVHLLILGDSQVERVWNHVRGDREQLNEPSDEPTEYDSDLYDSYDSYGEFDDDIDDFDDFDSFDNFTESNEAGKLDFIDVGVVDEYRERILLKSWLKHMAYCWRLFIEI